MKEVTDLIFSHAQIAATVGTAGSRIKLAALGRGRHPRHAVAGAWWARRSHDPQVRLPSNYGRIIVFCHRGQHVLAPVPVSPLLRLAMRPILGFIHSPAANACMHETGKLLPGVDMCPNSKNQDEMLYLLCKSRHKITLHVQAAHAIPDAVN